MLEDRPLFASFAVDDTEVARDFYRDTLGLDVRDSSQPGILEIHGTGGTPVTVYPKSDHEPAVFTVLNIIVPDVEEAVHGLAAKGVSIEHYDTDQVKTDDDGIARNDGGPTVAWFKDPAGNIVSVLEIETA